MKSSYITNLVLLVIVIILFWLTQKDSEQEKVSLQLATLTAAEVNQITIHRAQQPTIELSREGDQWQLQQPYPANANATRVKLVLSLPSSQIHGQLQAMDPSSLAQFGLSDPQVTVILNGQQFAFGNVEPINQYRYVLYQGMIYLIDDTVMPLLKSAANSFIDNRLLTENAQISAISLPGLDKTQNLSTEVKLTQHDGEWQAPSQQLSSDQLLTLIDNWQHAQAMQVVYQPEQAHNVAAATVEITLKDGKAPLQFKATLNEHNLILQQNDLHLTYLFPRQTVAELFPELP